MRGWKISVKPPKNGSIEIKLQAVDDAGRVLTSVVTAPDRDHFASTIQDAMQSLQALAANYTEEEGFNQA